MLTYQESLQVILSHARPLKPRPLPLSQALHRILAESILCPEDQPPFTRSAYDGFLVPDEGETRSYRIVGEVQPGRPALESLAPGAAWRIYTGSALPEETGSVFMVEETEEENGAVRLKPGATPVPPRRRGGDVAQGTTLFSPGHQIGPADLAAFATIGHTTPVCLPPPRIHHALTGSEIVPPETERLEPGCIRDSNTIMIQTMLHDRACPIHLHRQVPDEPESAWRALEEADFFSGELILISGGCSVGARDATREWLERAGFTLHFSRTRVRPGKPMVFATRGGQVAFGLPGNPVSHFTCMLLAVLPALDTILGLRPKATFVARLTARLTNSPDGRESFHPVRLEEDGDGGQTASPLPWKNSGNALGLIGCNGLARVPLDKASLETGEPVEIFSL